MIYCYLFEANFIQRFLFSSGKLKDVIAASERLDKLIDNHQDSVLYHVLSSAGLTSDLLEDNAKPLDIRFLRCKGGAFYASSEQKACLERLRSLWTLTLAQLFPSLAWSDALVEGASLQDAMEKGHKQMGADRNAPMIQFPLGSAICQRSQRTGQVAVPLSGLAAKQASDQNEQRYTTFLDLETEHHRQAYTHFDLKAQGALQGRFTPDDLQDIRYPIDLEKDFAFSAQHTHADNKDATKDIALIHIDGNGLGILLRALKEHLTKEQTANEEDYRKGFRLFSDSLAQATQQAAKSATAWLHNEGRYTDPQGNTMVPMRPLVLGGDDITLLCRADLALDYSEHFCRAFKSASETALKPLFDQYLKNAPLSRYLTASGGILYHKASHPFTHSHHLVEALCQEAKKLTKKVCATENEVGPPALAIYRLSNASAESFEQLKKQSRIFNIHQDGQKCTLELGQYAFYVADKHDQTASQPNFSQLRALARLCRESKAAVSMSKWRQIVSKLALGDKAEADRIYHRALALSKEASPKAMNTLNEHLDAILMSIKSDSGKLDTWFYQEGDALKTILNDLLIVDHFRPVVEPAALQEASA